MKYNKEPLSFEQQAQLLVDRGFNAPSKEDLVKFLSNVNYYRLSAYWYKYKTCTEDGKEFISPDINLTLLQTHYEFDRELRLLVLEPVEQIEIAVLRTRMVEQFSLKYGKFGYRDYRNFKPDCSLEAHQKMLELIESDINHSEEEFITRYRCKYAESEHFPLWIAVEAVSLGRLLTFFRLMKYEERDSIAQQFAVTGQVLQSWLLTIHYIRNVCAHYSRLWNRAIQVSPAIPRFKNNPDWHQPVRITPGTLFSVLTVLQYLLGYINPGNNWVHKLIMLFARYPAIPLSEMGFPDNWLDCPIWRQQQ